MPMSGIVTRQGLEHANNWILEYDSQGFVNSDIVYLPKDMSINAATGAPNGLLNPGPCHLLNVYAYNKSTTPLFLCLFDIGQAPVNGQAFPPVMMPIPLATQYQPLDLWLNDIPGGQLMYGKKFLKGLAYGISTSPTSFAIDASSSVWVNFRLQY